MNRDQVEKWLQDCLQSPNLFDHERLIFKTMLDCLPEAEEAPSVTQAMVGGKNGTRLTSAWEMPTEWKEWAKANGCDRVDHEAAQFKDFWIGKAGKDGIKLNWEATWRNWIRRNYDAPDQQTSGVEKFSAQWWRNFLGVVDGKFMKERLRNGWHPDNGPNPWKAINPNMPDEIRQEYKTWGWK